MTQSDHDHSPLLQELEYAVFSLGSYWRADANFGQIPGVLKTWVGLATGETVGPVEAVEVWFHPKRISYHALIRWFWDSINPQKLPEQPRYQPAIFAVDDKQAKAARRSVVEMEFKFKKELHSLVQPLANFEAAAQEHQKYYLQNNPQALAVLHPIFANLDALLKSTAAVRINSYLGGCASLEELEEQWEAVLALPEEPPELQSVLAELPRITAAEEGQN